MSASTSSTLPKRALGSQGLVVSAQGLGCMGMTAMYGSFDREASEPESLRTIARALELGVNFFDTAYCYQSNGVDGKPNVTNESLLGKAIRIHGRDKFIIATKFGIIPPASGPIVTNIKMCCGGSKPEAIRRQLEESLSRLGTDYIDLYYQHRADPETPAEEVAATLKELVAEGKIRYVGLSECTGEELRRFHAVHPVSAVEMEWSLHTRDAESEVIPVARELGVGIVAYSPLGRGLLSSTIKSLDDLDAKDWRRNAPRFSSEIIAENVSRLATFTALADRKGCTAAQLALAWVHAQGADVFPIPGTRHAARVDDNVAAFALSQTLTPAEVEEIAAAVSPPVGERYPAIGLATAFNSRVSAALA